MVPDKAWTIWVVSPVRAGSRILQPPSKKFLRVAGGLALAVFLLLQTASFAAEAGSASALRARYDGMRASLAHNQFGRPLSLDSSETESGLNGDIYGVVNFPFASVTAALKEVPHWCDILILHLNIKYCSPAPGQTLAIYVGSKKPQALATAFRMDYIYRSLADTPDYLQQAMSASKGPLGTKNYRMMLEAMPLDGGKTFLHVRYAYSQGMMARLATSSYLNTIGHDKVGFTPEKNAGGKMYVSGLRGAVERNTMRYYLAIEAYLGALGSPPREQLDKRFHDWFEYTERYGMQLHEISLNEYLDMKHEEYYRQQKQP